MRPLAAFLTMLLASAAAAQTTVDRRVPARPGGRVEIHNLAGSVVITGWDKDEVEVRGTLGRGVRELDLEGEGDTVEIDVELFRHGGEDANAELEVRLPAGSRVEVDTVSADVVAAGLRGRLEVSTVNGRIEVEGGLEAVELETVSGGVEVRGQVARIEVSTVSSTFRTRADTREIEAETVSGRLDVTTTAALDRAELSAVTGSIAFAGDLAAGAELDVSSHSGPVELVFPASLSAQVTATSFSGRITNELGPPAQSSGRFTPGKTLEFTAGRGEARVSVESFSGRIEIRKR